MPGEAALIQFAEAAVRHEETPLAEARLAIEDEFGGQAVVDAACIVGNFERMNRIADGCGISLDDMMRLRGGDLAAKLDINHYASAANTATPGLLGRLKLAILKPLFPYMMRRMQRGWEKEST